MTEQHREAYPIQWNAPGSDTGHAAWQGPRPDAELSALDPSTGGHGADSMQQSDASRANDSRSDAHASQPAGLGGPWGQQNSTAGEAEAFSPSANDAQVGWAGAASSGETAQEISQSHPQDSGYGWSNTGGSTRFDAPDRDDHAPRAAAAEAQDSAPAQAWSHAPADGRGGAPDGSQGFASQNPAFQDDAYQGYEAYQSHEAPQAHDAYQSAAPHASDAPQAQPASYASAPVSGSTGTDGGQEWGTNTYASAPPQVVSQRDDLPEDSLTIGRSRDNSIVLDDMLVSRRHVVITADDQGLLLRDLGSRNGTFVNGRRVEQTHLHEEDRIGIGASTFEVRDGWLVSV